MDAQVPRSGGSRPSDTDADTTHTHDTLARKRKGHTTDLLREPDTLNAGGSPWIVPTSAPEGS
eukprot:2551739-Alexandrium_andersonii.AAC.1